jgi:hypothetical protein
MSAKLSNLRKRLEKLEHEQAHRAERVGLADCNCPAFKSRLPLIFSSSEAFQDEMSKTCPVHKFRRLGKYTPIFVVYSTRTHGEDRTHGEEMKEDSSKLRKLVDEYELRLAQYLKTGIPAKKRMKTGKIPDSRCKGQSQERQTLPGCCYRRSDLGHIEGIDSKA